MSNVWSDKPCNKQKLMLMKRDRETKQMTHNVKGKPGETHQQKQTHKLKT
jgi:hypothetical protein